MGHWNIQVWYELVLQSPIESANSGEMCAEFRLNLYIPISHSSRRFVKNRIGVVVNHLVGKAL